MHKIILVLLIITFVSSCGFIPVGIVGVINAVDGASQKQKEEQQQQEINEARRKHLDAKKEKQQEEANRISEEAKLKKEKQDKFDSAICKPLFDGINSGGVPFDLYLKVVTKMGSSLSDNNIDSDKEDDKETIETLKKLNAMMKRKEMYTFADELRNGEVACTNRYELASLIDSYYLKEEDVLLTKRMKGRKQTGISLSLFTVSSNIETPKKSYVYFNNSNGEQYILKVIQVVNNGILVEGVNVQHQRGNFDGEFPDKYIFISTTKQSNNDPYIDGSYVEDGFYEYTGVYEYNSLTGKRKVYSFKPSNIKINDIFFYSF